MTAAPPSPMLCTSPYFPRASPWSDSPEACMGPAPANTGEDQYDGKTQNDDRPVLTIPQLHWSKSSGQPARSSFTSGRDVLVIEKCIARPVAPRGWPLASSPPLGLITYFPPYFSESKSERRHAFTQQLTVLSPRSTKRCESSMAHSPSAEYVTSYQQKTQKKQKHSALLFVKSSSV